MQRKQVHIRLETKILKVLIKKSSEISAVVSSLFPELYMCKKIPMSKDKDISWKNINTLSDIKKLTGKQRGDYFKAILTSNFFLSSSFPSSSTEMGTL